MICRRQSILSKDAARTRRIIRSEWGLIEVTPLPSRVHAGYRACGWSVSLLVPDYIHRRHCWVTVGFLVGVDLNTWRKRYGARPRWSAWSQLYSGLPAVRGASVTDAARRLVRMTLELERLLDGGSR